MCLFLRILCEKQPDNGKSEAANGLSGQGHPGDFAKLMVTESVSIYLAERSGLTVWPALARFFLVFGFTQARQLPG